MAILARVQESASGERRRAARRRLQLVTEGATLSTPHIQVVIHDLSVTGLLIETFAHFSVGERIEVQLPETGTTEALIVWSSGRYFGCRFVQPISTGAVSAALLLSPGHSPAAENAELMAIAMAELRALATRVERITDKIDQAIDRRRDDALPDSAAAAGAHPSEEGPAADRMPRLAAYAAIGAGVIAVVAAYLSLAGGAPAAVAAAMPVALLVLAAIAWGVWVQNKAPY